MVNMLYYYPRTFYILLCDMWQFVTVIYNIMLISNFKFENKKINEKENRKKKVYYLQL